jgi:hypothetical protein
MGWGPDKAGINGVFLSKDVVKHAGKALELCLCRITPQLLTWGQWGEAAVNVAQKTLLGADIPEYRPDYTRCIDHFAIHAGAPEPLSSVAQVDHRRWVSFIYMASIIRARAATWCFCGVVACCMGSARRVSMIALCRLPPEVATPMLARQLLPPLYCLLACLQDSCWLAHLRRHYLPHYEPHHHCGCGMPGIQTTRLQLHPEVHV